MFKHKKLLFTLSLLILIAIVTACGGGSDNNEANDGNNNEGNATASGEEVYKSNCAACHGDDGGGNPSLQGNDFAADVDNVVDQVTNGGETMPEFGSKLSDDEIQAVSEYVSEEIAK